MRSPGEGMEVFIAHAEEDEKLADELENHLAPLKRQGLVSSWHYRKIRGGGEWDRDIHEHLETFGIFLPLVSADFMASDYCYDIEMARALERHEAGEAIVIPVIVRDCDWKGAPFAKLQAAPGKPPGRADVRPAVESWPNRDEAFAKVANRVRERLEGLVQEAARGRVLGHEDAGEPGREVGVAKPELDAQRTPHLRPEVWSVDVKSDWVCIRLRNLAGAAAIHPGVYPEWTSRERNGPLYPEPYGSPEPPPQVDFATCPILEVGQGGVCCVSMPPDGSGNVEVQWGEQPWEERNTQTWSFEPIPDREKEWHFVYRREDNSFAAHDELFETEPPMYHTPLVCRTGHIIAESLQHSPAHRQQNFCELCGEPAFFLCPKCEAPIRGDYEKGDEMDDIWEGGAFRPYLQDLPRYCYNCGTPYPWTDQAIAELAALTEEAPNLSREERAEVSAAVQDIVKETPRKDDAMDVLQELFQKAGGTFWEEAKDILARVTAYCMRPGP